MPAAFQRNAKTAAVVSPCDFSKFEIDDPLKGQLEQVGSFACDKIWYGEVQKTMTSGHIDGYRWLFAVMGREWFFLVFKSGDEELVQWDNSKALSFEESWDLSNDLDACSPSYLPHSQLFGFLLKGVEAFRAERPFDG